MTYVIGISAYYHDSACALIKNGEIISAVQEERFTRKKHDSSFPNNAILFCLKSQNINLKDVKEIIYYEKPLLTFERLLETYLGAAPRGGRSFVAAMQVWLKEKLFLKTNLNLLFACKGVKFSNRILFFVLDDISELILSIFNNAKYLSPSFGGLILPCIVSPVLSENFLI